MVHPLDNYRVISKISFIESIDFEFYTKHFNFLNNGLSATIDKKKEGIYVHGFDLETGEFSSFITIYTFFEQEYNRIEKEARSIIDKIILDHLDDKKQETFIKSVIAELQLLQTKISAFQFLDMKEKLKTILVEKVKSFSQTLGMIYLNTGILTNTPKIRWLDKTNMLTTLIYDLWQGQDKGSKNPKSKKWIEAEKKTLIDLLLNNFTDEKGQPLKESVVSDYLNTSKPEKRAKIGTRIELSN